MSHSTHDKQHAELEERLALLELRLRIARTNRDLLDIIERYPTLRVLSDADVERVDSVGLVLAQRVREEIRDLQLSEPEHVDIDEFVKKWVDHAWLRSLSQLRFENSQVPQTIVDDALRDLYREDYRVHEDQEELFELQQKGFRWFASGRVVAYRQRTRASLIRARLWSYGVRGRLLGTVRGGSVSTARATQLAAELTRLSAAWSAFKSRRRHYWFAKRASEVRTGRIHHWIQAMFTRFSSWVAGFAALFMFLMLCVGLSTLLGAVLLGCGIDLGPVLFGEGPWWKHVTPKSLDTHGSVLKSLTALEMILVAPLPYLLILGLSRYIKALAYQERADQFRKEVLEFKAFEVALFIAIIATAVIARIVKGQLELEFASAVALIVAVLCSYYFLVERSARWPTTPDSLSSPREGGPASNTRIRHAAHTTRKGEDHRP